MVPDNKELLFVLDEPEQAFDVDGLEAFYAWVCKVAQRHLTQILIGTHSPFLILEPTFNVIDMAGFVSVMVMHAKEVPL